jgi:hypothetical protein
MDSEFYDCNVLWVDANIFDTFDQVSLIKTQPFLSVERK